MRLSAIRFKWRIKKKVMAKKSGSKKSSSKGYASNSVAKLVKSKGYTMPHGYQQVRAAKPKK